MNTEQEQPTEAASTAELGGKPTEPADLAWSQESETVELRRRDWRGVLLWAALVALLCSTVGAVLVFSSVLYRSQFSRPVQSPPTSAAVRPSAPPTTATVTVTPAAPVSPSTTQPAPSTVVPAPLSATDQQFLLSLRGAGISYPSADYAISHAHGVCDYMATHGGRAADGTAYVERTTGWYGLAAVEFSDYAKGNYCPQYLPGDY